MPSYLERIHNMNNLWRDPVFQLAMVVTAIFGLAAFLA